jgi:hypothetical protein
MIDAETNKPVRVLLDAAGEPYIRLSPTALERVRPLLSENNISYWVDHWAISIDDKPFEMMVYIRRGTDPGAVQAVLDRVA